MSIICQPTIVFAIIMSIYVLAVSQTKDIIAVRMITVGIISFCIQYLCYNNFPFIAWMIASIPIFYILSIYIMLYLINDN